MKGMSQQEATASHGHPWGSLMLSWRGGSGAGGGRPAPLPSGRDAVSLAPCVQGHRCPRGQRVRDALRGGEWVR